MTRKDYIALALALKNQRESVRRPSEARDVQMVNTMLDLACFAVADVCAAGNSRFDRSRFLTACGVQP